ncbi:MAG: MFS transporter [Candidatus Syntropharchaeia archaeon]
MKRELYLLCASLLPLMISSGMIYSIFSLYMEDLGASRSQIGLIFTVSAAAGIFAAPLFGRLSDRIGRKKVMIISMISFSIIFFLYSIARTYIHLFPIQALEGAIWAALGTTIPAFIADIVPAEERGESMGVYNMTWNLGWVIGPVMGGFLAENVGFRWCFSFCAVLILFGLVFLLIFVGEPKDLSQDHRREE